MRKRGGATVTERLIQKTLLQVLQPLMPRHSRNMDRASGLAEPHTMLCGERSIVCDKATTLL